MLSVSYVGKNAHSASKTSGVLGGGAYRANRCYVLAHILSNKTYQGTQGTQELTSIGSTTSHGPSMDSEGGVYLIDYKFSSPSTACFEGNRTISSRVIILLFSL